MTINNLADKELVIRSTSVLSALSDNPPYHRYLDMPAVTTICLRVLQEYPTTMACTARVLNVLKQLTTSETATKRLRDQCHVLHAVLQDNLTTSELCEQVVFLMMMVTRVSHLFRVQCIQNGLLQLLLEVVARHGKNHHLLSHACHVFIELSKEAIFENNACRLTIIDYTLTFLSSSLFGRNTAFIALVLQTIKAVACISRGSIQYFVRKQGLMHLTTLLGQFVNCADVFAPCCDLLAAVCANYSASREILAIDLIPNIVTVLTSNPYETIDTLESCIQALRAIANLSIDCVKCLISSSLIQFLLQAVTADRKKSIVLESMIILYRMSLVDDGCQQLIQENAEGLLGEFPKSFSPEEKTRIQCEMLLSNLQLFMKKRGKSSHWSVPVTLTADLKGITMTMFGSPLMVIMSGLMQVDGMSESDVLIHLRQLSTLCDDGK